MFEQEESISALQLAFTLLEPDLRFRDEAPALQACALALEALGQGGYGVGALIMDEDHRIWAEAGNAMLRASLDSSAHAEMLALDRFECLDNHQAARAMTLLVTQEPCPMCLTRALYAGVGSIVYLAEDGAGGMVHCRDSLPPALRELAHRVNFRRAEVSEPLRDLARRLARGRLEVNRTALLAAQRGEMPTDADA